MECCQERAVCGRAPQLFPVEGRFLHAQPKLAVMDEGEEGPCFSVFNKSVLNTIKEHVVHLCVYFTVAH